MDESTTITLERPAEEKNVRANTPSRGIEPPQNSQIDTTLSPEKAGNVWRKKAEDILHRTPDRRQMLIAGGATIATVTAGEIAKHHPIARMRRLLKDAFTQPDVHQLEPRPPSSEQTTAEEMWDKYQKNKSGYTGIVYRNISPLKENGYINLRSAPRVITKGVDPDEYKTNYIGSISLKDSYFKPIEEALPFGNKTDDGNWATFFLPQWDREGKPIIEGGHQKGQMVFFVIENTEHTT